MNLYSQRGSPSTYRILRRVAGTSTTRVRELLMVLRSPSSGSSAKRNSCVPGSPAGRSMVRVVAVRVRGQLNVARGDQRIAIVDPQPRGAGAADDECRPARSPSNRPARSPARRAAPAPGRLRPAPGPTPTVWIGTPYEAISVRRSSLSEPPFSAPSLNSTTPASGMLPALCSTWMSESPIRVCGPGARNRVQRLERRRGLREAEQAHLEGVFELRERALLQGSRHVLQAAIGLRRRTPCWRTHRWRPRARSRDPARARRSARDATAGTGPRQPAGSAGFRPAAAAASRAARRCHKRHGDTPTASQNAEREQPTTARRSRKRTWPVR